MLRRATFASTTNCVAIVCDKAVYYSGDVIRGYVMLNVHTPFTARSLNVEVIGFESTNWTEIIERIEPQLDGYRDVIIRAPRHARRDFIDINVPLYAFDPSKLLMPGQYQFPFQVTLPANLPGSFLYEDSYYCRGQHTFEGVVGKVRYKVTAGLVRGATLNGICPELYDSHEIYVRQRLLRPMSELSVESVSNVESCCFSRGGCVVVRLRANKDSYTAGETAHVSLEIENHTNLSFPDIYVEIDRIVHLVSHNGHYRHEDKMYRQRFEGVGKGESRIGESSQQLAVPLPAAMVPTTMASLVKCSYRLWVELPAGIFTTNPRLCVPLTIHAVQPAQVAYVAPPPDYWKPQMVAPPVEIALPSAPPLDAPLPPAAMPPTGGDPSAPPYAPPPPSQQPPYNGGPVGLTPNPVYGGR